MQVFGGGGFVGSAFVKRNPQSIVKARDDYTVGKEDILYMISTVTNYHVKTDPYIDIDTNLTTLMRVLNQCKDSNLVFNFVSSWFVYGQTQMPATEESISTPRFMGPGCITMASDLAIARRSGFNPNCLKNAAPSGT